MNCIEDVTNAVFSKLSSGCSGVTFVRSFPKVATEFPVKEPTVSLGIKRAEIPLSEGVYLGKTSDGTKCYGAFATITYSLTICVPKALAGQECYKTFDKIANALLGKTAFFSTAVRCGDIYYDRNMGALVLPAEIDIKAELMS